MCVRFGHSINGLFFVGCRAAAHLKLGNAEAALKDAEVATELDPQYARAYVRRAAAHQALEHFEEAVRDYEKVRCRRSVCMCKLMLSMLC